MGISFFIVNFAKILAKISKIRTMTKKHDIIWFDEVDSTNNEAARHISELDNLSVLSARRQFSGRGQRDHVWISEDGKNLTFSVVLKYNTPGAPENPSYLRPFIAKNQAIISDTTVSSVLELLHRHNIEGSIKLPNDILIGDKKICGILIEHVVKGMYLTYSIVGIGLNVNQRDFDITLPDATSIALLKDNTKDPAHDELDLATCLEGFMGIFTRA